MPRHVHHRYNVRESPEAGRISIPVPISTTQVLQVRDPPALAPAKQQEGVAEAPAGGLEEAGGPAGGHADERAVRHAVPRLRRLGGEGALLC